MDAINQFADTLAALDAATAAAEAASTAAFLAAWDALGITEQHFHIHTPDEGGDRSFTILASIDVVDGELVDRTECDGDRLGSLTSDTPDQARLWLTLNHAAELIPVEHLWAAAVVEQAEDLDYGGWNHTLSIDNLRAHMAAD